jgi:hypothetical protein
MTKSRHANKAWDSYTHSLCKCAALSYQPKLEHYSNPDLISLSHSNEVILDPKSSYRYARGDSEASLRQGPCKASESNTISGAAVKYYQGLLKSAVYLNTKLHLFVILNYWKPESRPVNLVQYWGLLNLTLWFQSLGFWIECKALA